MFSLLMPLFMWGAIAASVPLVIHLLQRRRTVQIPFSTVRFLELAQRHSSSKLRIENLLLLIIRMLMIMLLSMAFALPIVRTTGISGLLGTAKRDVAIVIDGSYSMRYKTGKATAWDEAQEAAMAIVKGLSDGDRLCVFTATDAVEPVIEQMTSDRDFVGTRVAALEPGTTSSRLMPSVAAAAAALKKDRRRREREIHVLTDGQALPWGSEVFDHESLPRKTVMFITLTGAVDPENGMAADVQLMPNLIMDNVASRVEARVSTSGNIVDGVVSVFVNDREEGRRAFNPLTGDSGGKIAFTLPPLEAGVHAGRVETQADNLPFDNAFHFLIDVRDEIPVLCVGSEEDSLFLQRALEVRVSAKSVIRPTRIDPGSIGRERLHDYQCIFLCNALPLIGQDVLKVENYIQDGGTVVLFPGNQALPSDYTAWKSIPPPALVAELQATRRTHMLHWQDLQHPLFKTLAPGKEAAPVLTIRRMLTWESIPDSAISLVTAGADKPFLIDHRYGSGHMLIFSTSADRSWSNLPLSPYFLPMVHQAVQFGAGVAGGKPYNWTTRNMTMRGALADPTTALEDPDGNSVSVRATMVEGETIRYAENLLLPGIYRDAAGRQSGGTPALALNVERRESDLAPIQEGQIPDLLGDAKVHIARGLPDLERLIEDHRIGRSLSESFLWLVLVLAVLELLFANFKARTAKPSKAPIAAEASGRIVREKPGSSKKVRVPVRGKVRISKEAIKKMVGKSS